MFITNKERSDGFGAQYQNIIFTILFSELSNLEFVYTPFSFIEHNYESDPDFIIKKENFINLLGHYKEKKDADIDSIVTKELSEIYRTVEDNLDFCLNTDSFKKIKNLFWQNKNKKIDKDKKYVSIHIRRPNQFDIGTYGYTTDDYYLKVIHHIISNHDNIGKIKIFSQGEEKEFQKFIDLGVELHLNESIESTFLGLVSSDIIVTSKSSFSYCAALLSEGIVYYLPFWHKPKSTWITI